MLVVWILNSGNVRLSQRDIQIIFDLAGYNIRNNLARGDNTPAWIAVNGVKNVGLLIWIMNLNQLHLPILLMAVIQNPYLRPRTDQRDCYQEFTFLRLQKARHLHYTLRSSLKKDWRVWLAAKNPSHATCSHNQPAFHSNFWRTLH